MNGYVKKILGTAKSKDTREAVKKELFQLKKDIEFAYKVLDNEYSYCSDCDDYYLTGSFQTETKYEVISVCVYEDFINSGGNEYKDKTCRCTYSICPKGHVTKIEQTEVN